MTESLPPPPQQLPAPSSNKKQKKYIILAALFFILCAAAFLIYWLVWGRYHETTDDSYVNGNMILITPQVKGIVTTILVDNTELVEAGQPIVQLDPHDFEIAFDQAKAELANTVRTVHQLFIKVNELEAKQDVARANLLKTSLDYKHRLALVDDGSVSREDFEHSETALMAALAYLVEVEEQWAGSIAEVENTTIETHPKVEQAKAHLRTAYLALHRCTVLAPTKGIITQRRAQVGQWVKAEDPLMALVPVDQMWVDANFREVSLKNFRIGQPVEMYADMYGKSLKFHGCLVGLNPGTGAVFSILPPQNATGNWIKIIQRIPVKISFDPKELADHPLVLGLTMTVTVDTHTRKGLQLPNQAEKAIPIYESDVYADELKGAEVIIDQIIKANYVADNDTE